MTNDELRERIADMLEAMDGTDYDDAAQAIIDDLGLMVEEAIDYDNRTRRNGIIHYGAKTRIVGKWESERA